MTHWLSFTVFFATVTVTHKKELIGHFLRSCDRASC